MLGIPLGRLLLAGIIVGVLGVGSTLMSPMFTGPVADMRIEPQSGTRTVGETFVVEVVVEASEPVNVFKGDIHFDPDILRVESISYNSSIADLWAEEPWYSNGDGTLNFIGGSTKDGGFSGVGSLLTITFRTANTGRAVIAMNEVRILRHDGLGSDAPLLEPIDAIFRVKPEELARQTVVEKSAAGLELAVLPKPPSPDLNSDGRQTIADTSIFMQHLLTQNRRSDFNGDGKVNTADLSILMDAR